MNKFYSIPSSFPSSIWREIERLKGWEYYFTELLLLVSRGRSSVVCAPCNLEGMKTL